VILVYAPEGAKERRWTYQPEKLMSSEAEAIEKVTGLTYEEFGQALLKGSATARRALLWVLMKREEPQLRHASVDPPVGTLKLEYEQHELRSIRDAVEADPDLSDSEREVALREMDKLIDESEGEAPKAPASDADSNT